MNAPVIAFPQDSANAETGTERDIERTVHTMQDEATVFADPNDRASRKPIWRSNCATATASAS